MRSRLGLVLGLVATLSAGRAEAQASIVPEWFGRESEVLSGHREGTIPDAASLLPATTAPTDPIASALLVCAVATSDAGPHGRWDTFADPDLRIELRIGRFHGTAWGPENSMTASVSFAGVALRRGDRVEARVWDRDVTGDERIDTLTGRFDGTFPLALAHGVTTVSCQLADAARVAERGDAALARAEAPLVVVEHAQPALTDDVLGRPMRELAVVSSNVALAMGYLGLAEPRARALRDRLDDAERAFDRALGALVTTALRTPTPDPLPVAGTTSTVQLVGTLTSRAAIRARYPDAPDPIAEIVELTVTPAPSELHALLGTPDAVDARGNVIASLDVVHAAGDPTRVGIAFSVRPRASVVRVGVGVRTLLVVR